MVQHDQLGTDRLKCIDGGKTRGAVGHFCYQNNKTDVKGSILTFMVTEADRGAPRKERGAAADAI
jgi:hypothetical protein